MLMHTVTFTCSTRWLKPFYPSKMQQSLQWRGGAVLNDVVNVPARSDLMRGRFEKGYIDVIADMVKKMTDEIAATVEEN